MSAETHSPPLPPEIIFEILSYLKHESRRSLCCYALISSHWVPAVHSLVFREFTFRNKIGQFKQLTRSPYCSFAKHVQKLYFHNTAHKFKSFAQKIGKVMRAFPNVNWVSISNEWIVIGASYHGALTGFDQIETLVLMDQYGHFNRSFLKGLLSLFFKICSLEIPPFLTSSTRAHLYGDYDTRRPCGDMLLPRLNRLSTGVVSTRTLFDTSVCLANICDLRLRVSADNFFICFPRCSVKTLLRTIGLQLQYLTLEFEINVYLWDFFYDGAYSEGDEGYDHCGHENWHDLDANQNLQTLTLYVFHDKQYDLYGDLLSQMKVPNIRRVTLIIVLPAVDLEQVATQARGIIHAINQRPAYYDRLEEIVFTMKGSRESDKGEAISVLRNVLDPGGRRGWWEKGLLKVDEYVNE